MTRISGTRRLPLLSLIAEYCISGGTPQVLRFTPGNSLSFFTSVPPKGAQHSNCYGPDIFYNKESLRKNASRNHPSRHRHSRLVSQVSLRALATVEDLSKFVAGMANLS